MPLHGHSFIGNETTKGTHGSLQGVNPATGDNLQPVYGGNSMADLDRACTLAARAFDPYRSLPLEKRAAFLEQIAANITALGDELIERAMTESGLPRARLEGERGRTIGQLKQFAGVIRDGGFLNVRIDPALPDRTPLPRPDLRMRNIPVGPVAVFGASNFPLAFSVAGGDTASALAAGCPVIVKAHPAHPGTSELMAQAIQKAARESGMPEGTFSMLFDSSYELGAALVADARMYAVGFTGSRRGGLALMEIAAKRKRPIPVYAEMSSINPVVLLPGALAQNAAAIGKSFAGALTLGSGQFCTNPGLILAIDGADLDTFLDSAATTLADISATTMLTPGIHGAYCKGVEQLAQQTGVTQIARGKTAGLHQAQAGLFAVPAATFLGNHVLHDEIFGSTALVVRCPDLDTLIQIVESLEGQLTGAIHMTAADNESAAKILPVLERQVGRILVNGFGTGVEVASAMVHGGPFPATSDGRSTSVGTLAIDRFLRPVCYQDVPATLLAPELQGNTAGAQPRRIDGKLITQQ